jgi:hypothetical protein
MNLVNLVAVDLRRTVEYNVVIVNIEIRSIDEAYPSSVFAFRGLFQLFISHPPTRFNFELSPAIFEACFRINQKSNHMNAMRHREDNENGSSLWCGCNRQVPATKNVDRYS